MIIIFVPPAYNQNTDGRPRLPGILSPAAVAFVLPPKR